MCLKQMSVVGLFQEIRKARAELVVQAERLQAVYEELLPYETAFTNEEEATWEDLDQQLDELYQTLDLMK